MAPNIPQKVCESHAYQISWRRGLVNRLIFRLNPPPTLASASLSMPPRDVLEA